MTTIVIQASERPRVERDQHGRVSTVIGCVDTGRAEINLSVSGTTVDLSLATRLEDEERTLAATNALTEGQAHSYIELDEIGLGGLIRLLTHAREVHRLADRDPESG